MLLETKAHKLPSGKISVTCVFNNSSDETVTFGGMTSQVYDIHAESDSVKSYGDSTMSLQAPHHIDIPSETSFVFGQDFETEQSLEEEFEDLSFDVDEFIDEINPLGPTVSELVTVTVKIYTRGDDSENLEESFSFVPCDVPMLTTEEVVEELSEFEVTENTVELG